jgi:hypothetical protein
MADPMFYIYVRSPQHKDPYAIIGPYLTEKAAQAAADFGKIIGFTIERKPG